MERYKIEVSLFGLDEATVFVLECTKEQFVILQEASIASMGAAVYQWMPIMEVRMVD